jgi:hypothetical protein
MDLAYYANLQFMQSFDFGKIGMIDSYAKSSLTYPYTTLEQDMNMMSNFGLVLLAFLLVFMNAFFVAAEFGMVKLRNTRIQAIKVNYGLRAICSRISDLC